MNFYLLWLAVQGEATGIISEDKFLKIIDEAAQKDFKWWFTAVFVILIVSGYLLLKALLKQLSEQRAAALEKDKELINYLKTDQIKTLASLQEVTHAFAEFTKINERMISYLDSKFK